MHVNNEPSTGGCDGHAQRHPLTATAERTADPPGAKRQRQRGPGARAEGRAGRSPGQPKRPFRTTLGGLQVAELFGALERQPLGLPIVMGMHFF